MLPRRQLVEEKQLLLHTHFTVITFLNSVALSFAVLRYVTLRYVTLRYATLRYVTLWYVLLCYVMLKWCQRGGERNSFCCTPT
jgi:uncharacterized protein YjbI with pentapeptide repeats